jgi:hypothetical protein
LAVVCVALLALTAGCTGAVTTPETVSNTTQSGYELTDVSVWTAGTLFEYDGALVVTGTLRSTADVPQPMPRVEARIGTADGWTVVAATYTPDRRLVDYDTIRDRPLNASEAIDFRIVYEPDERRTITNVTVRTVEGG